MEKVLDRKLIAGINEGIERIIECTETFDGFRGLYWDHIAFDITVLSKCESRDGAVIMDPDSLLLIARGFDDYSNYGLFGAENFKAEHGDRFKELAKQIYTWLERTERQGSLSIPTAQFTDLGNNVVKLAETYREELGKKYNPDPAVFEKLAMYVKR